MKREDKERNFIFNKKGIELTMNTVIIAILVVLVLVVVVGFFLGGTNKAKSTVVDIFNAGTAGSDIGFAVEQCRNYCTQAESWPAELRGTSPYCTHAFKLDTHNAGKADTYTDADDKEKISEYYCTGTKLNVPCPGILTQDGAIPTGCNEQDVIA